MCGIVGYIGPKDPVPILMDGLKHLEYRGYDSAGVAVLEGGVLTTERAAGKLVNLADKLRLHPLAGSYGLGHTRWATHGRPTEENAHPHTDCKGQIVVVHNGIIENYLALKEELRAKGHRFRTETDTEIVAHMLEDEGDDLEVAMRAVSKRLAGIFALAAASTRDPGRIVATRQGPPLVVGLGRDENFVASDIPAILHHTRDMVFLDDGEMAVVTRDQVRFTDLDGEPAGEEPPRASPGTPSRPRRPASSTSCRRRSTSSPGPSRTPSWGGSPSTANRVYLEELNLSRRPSPRTCAAWSSWPAGPPGTRRSAGAT